MPSQLSPSVNTPASVRSPVVSVQQSMRVPEARLFNPARGERQSDCVDKLPPHVRSPITASLTQRLALQAPVQLSGASTQDRRHQLVLQHVQQHRPLPADQQTFAQLQMHPSHSADTSPAPRLYDLPPSNLSSPKSQDVSYPLSTPPPSTIRMAAPAPNTITFPTRVIQRSPSHHIHRSPPEIKHQMPSHLTCKSFRHSLQQSPAHAMQGSQFQRQSPVPQSPRTRSIQPSPATGNSVATHPAGPAPTAAHREAPTTQYWNRLHSLLTSANTFAARLQLDRSGPRPDETSRQVAFDLQGASALGADAHVAKQPDLYRTSYAERAAGDFVEYGVPAAHAVWIAQNLAEIVPARSAPSSTLHDSTFEGTCADAAVEDVRLRVFEAEVAYLPVDFVESLLKRRRGMRKYKTRIDLCVRILLALECRGRRPTQASLDKLKLQLEKAELQARIEAEKEASRMEKDRLKSERGRKNGVKADNLKKRKRQQTAQASFMRRLFKTADGKNERDEQALQVVEAQREGFAAPIAQDKDVMSVSWWVRTEMTAKSPLTLDKMFRASTFRPTDVKALREHLSACATRRCAAESRVHAVLREYRQQRRVHADTRTPCLVSKRAEVRGRYMTGPVKLLQFAENHRPAYFGSFSRRSRSVSGRRPLRKDDELDYDYYSADEWDEDEEGEDLLDVEAEEELASEEAELRKLYGSDEEEDDDFLDDGDVEDDEEEEYGEGGEERRATHKELPLGSRTSSPEIAPHSKKDESDGVIDLSIMTVKSPGKEPGTKRSAKDAVGRRNGKRRKVMFKQSVTVLGVSLPCGEPSPLDRFPVTSFEGAQPIQMFNPFVFNASDIAAEHLKARPPSTRVGRPSVLDERAKLDLAAALMRAGSSRDKIVVQFSEHRKMRGLTVPSKSEILRAIAEIATREKREGDTRAFWYLNDQSLVRKLQQMNAAASSASAHARAPMLVE